MSDTPRTNLNHLTVETLRTLKGTGTKIVLADFARDLERELAAAKERIRRLEEAGSELRECASQFGCTSTDDSSWISRAEKAVKTWDKEAKP